MRSCDRGAGCRWGRVAGPSGGQTGLCGRDSRGNDVLYDGTLGEKQNGQTGIPAHGLGGRGAGGCPAGGGSAGGVCDETLEESKTGEHSLRRKQNPFPLGTRVVEARGVTEGRSGGNRNGHPFPLGIRTGCRCFVRRSFRGEPVGCATGERECRGSVRWCDRGRRCRGMRQRSVGARPYGAGAYGETGNTMR